MSDWGLDESGLNLADQDIVDCSGNMELRVMMEVSKFQTSHFDPLKSNLCNFLHRGLNADIKDTFLWHSIKFTEGLMTFYPSVIQATCQLRKLHMNLPEICSWKISAYLRRWDICTFLLSEENLIWLYFANSINSVSRAQQVCPILAFPAALFFFYFLHLFLLPIKFTQISIFCFLWRKFPQSCFFLSMSIRDTQLKWSDIDSLEIFSHKPTSLLQTLSGIWAGSPLPWGMVQQLEKVKSKAFLFLLHCFLILLYLPSSLPLLAVS